jgi:hypothetical protein
MAPLIDQRSPPMKGTAPTPVSQNHPLGSASIANGPRQTEWMFKLVTELEMPTSAEWPTASQGRGWRERGSTERSEEPSIWAQLPRANRTFEAEVPRQWNAVWIALTSVQPPWKWSRRARTSDNRLDRPTRTWRLSQGAIPCTRPVYT